ncbi:Ribosomal RNA small subunit methyltransferase I [[Clostridium] ultunense Esp]|uniref:16S rRNA (cytidine(1402)-2'-O)-methyltransferase n=1 Tax=Thermicanus aegyptius TaxID=94009 RepID=UPI0002B6FC92|nr:16S rRNA (cytidine(1402)-2'-O)-methyltransferase [Thermicanus aegyptius]CCQ98214.1 Ribosomal RNA small subunit methyltransferase I [[Clostridium] ultunense Esp]
MKRVKSFATEQGGVLYLVGTPIGNLQDMTERAIHTLKEVDFIAAEDTRVTRKLLSHFDIHTPLISYHQHSSKGRMEELIKQLKEGKQIALVSDAGLPGISDPGQELVEAAVREEIRVIPIPGVNAAISALIASGLPTQPFLFIGFLPRNRKERIEELERWKEAKATLLFYESPHRVKSTLKDMTEILGDRKAVLARELTKRHEEWIRGSLTQISSWLDGEEIKGEITLVVEGSAEEESSEKINWWDGISIKEHVEIWVQRGMDRKQAILTVAKERKISKREVYQAIHVK